MDYYSGEFVILVAFLSFFVGVLITYWYNSNHISEPFRVYNEDKEVNINKLNQNYTVEAKRTLVSKDGKLDVSYIYDSGTVGRLILTGFVYKYFLPHERDVAADLITYKLVDPLMEEKLKPFKHVKQFPSRDVKQYNEYLTNLTVMKTMISVLKTEDLINLLVKINDPNLRNMVNDLEKYYVYRGNGKQGIDWQYKSDKNPKACVDTEWIYVYKTNGATLISIERGYTKTNSNAKDPWCKIMVERPRIEVPFLETSLY